VKLILLISTLLFTIGVSAEILKWTDSDGRVHFGDKPPAGAETSIVEVKINTYESPNIEALQEILNPKDKVVMYSAEWCGVCKKAKKYFRANNIPYKDYDIDKSSKGKKDYKKLGAKGVPVILVGKKRLNGFSAATFESIYN
jgi:glutaredoxin